MTAKSTSTCSTATFPGVARFIVKSNPSLPGHAFVYSVCTGQYKEWDWTLRETPTDPGLGFEDAVVVFKEKLGRSVRNRWIADVPVGIFLSGGLDSSAIVAEVQSQLGAVDTYSIGYRENKDYDETKYASQVANFLGASHTIIYPERPTENLEVYIDCILDYFDQPYANPTVMMLYLLTSSVRDKATVALIGDGGDEILAGYSRHRALQLLSRYRPLRALSPFARTGFSFLRESPSVLTMECGD